MNRFDRLLLRRRSPAPWLLFFLLSARLADAASWAPVGPGAGPIVSLTVHPGSPGQVWLGMPNGGLYRSQNRGESWTWVGQPFGEGLLDRNAIEAIDADRSLPGRLFAATGAGVYRTDDGGAHWVKVSAPGFSDLLPAGWPLYSLAVAPGALYLSAGRRLLVSTDGGQSFEVRFEAQEGPGLQIAADRWQAGLICLNYFAAGATHLKMSTNAGKSWSEVGVLPDQGWIGTFAAAGGALYVESYGDASTLWRSRDGGATWQRLLDGGSGPLLLHPLKPRTLYWSRRAESNHPMELVVSRNGGDSWKVLGPLPFYLQPLAIDPGSGTFYGLGEVRYRQSALIRSVDGKTWEPIFTAPSPEGEVARLSFRPGRPRHQKLTIGFNLYRSFDGGASWAWRATPIWPGDVALDGSDPNRLIAVTSLNAYLSEDGGRTWRSTSSEITYGEGLIRSDRATLFAIGCGIARSTDNGASWRIVLPCGTPYADAGRWTAKLDVDPVRLDRVYALSFQAELDGLPHGLLQGSWPSSLWRSGDGGTTWRKAAANLSAFALERGTGKLYGIRNTALLTSDDAGRTWRVAGTAPEGAVDLIVDPAEPGVLYTNGRGGLQRSSDQGATWEAISPAGGGMLQFHPANPRVIFTSRDAGVYRLTLP